MQHLMQQILEKTEHVLNKTLSLVFRCRTDTIRKRVFNIIPKSTFHRTSSQLENTISNVSWLLRISHCNEDHDSENHILPSIILNDPMVTLIWQLIASLCTSSQEDRSDSASSLVSLAHRSNHYGKMIIEEGGVGPLLMFMDEREQRRSEKCCKSHISPESHKIRCHTHHQHIYAGGGVK